MIKVKRNGKEYTLRSRNGIVQFKQPQRLPMWQRVVTFIRNYIW